MFTAVVSVGLMAHSMAQAQTAGAPPQGRATAESQTAVDRDSSVDFPPLPKTTVSLIGGTVVKMDPIHDRVVLRAFGGREMTIDFDVRTKVLRENKAVATREIQPGSRIYADTLMVSGRIFAKTIRIQTRAAVGEASGQVMSYDPTKNLLQVHIGLSPEPLEVRITPKTIIRAGDQPVQPSQLAAGALVKIVFRSRTEHAETAQTIDVLAQPGGTFTFAGKMTFVDLRAGYVAVADQAGSNTYEVAVDRLTPDAKLGLKEGTDVIIHAQFDGRKYQAQSIEAAPSNVN